MARRPVYAALCPLRLNISLRQDAFLSTMARQLGIGKGEFLHRILADAMMSWSQAGLYVPPSPQPQSRENIPARNGE
jgi:hypothetical protein